MRRWRFYLTMTTLTIVGALAASCRTQTWDAPTPTLTIRPISVEAEIPSPEQVTMRLVKTVKRVRNAVVGVELDGFASGIVISPEGYVLTAGHVVAKSKLGQKTWVTFENGRQASAVALGCDESADLGLLKIIEEGAWPSVALANRVPPKGTYCFTLAHPGGFEAHRPAQIRLGRITSVVQFQKTPLILQADVNIRPGDSGGPLFDVDGRLIGIDSSAVALLGFNRFACIDRFHASVERLVRGERFGHAALGPSNTVIKGGKVSSERYRAMRAEVIRRWKIGHWPTVDLVAKHLDGDGRPKLTPQQVADVLGKDALPLMHGHEVALGMDDPAAIKRLPALPKTAVSSVPLRAGPDSCTLGLPVSDRLVLVKTSEFQALGRRPVKLREDGPSVTIVARDPQWDLALADCGDGAGLSPIALDGVPKPVVPGQGLMSPTVDGRIDWGVLSGPVFEVKEVGTTGPISDSRLVSVKRAPFKRVLSHDLPLFAADACRPVYAFDGSFVGVHLARLSRTTGLIVTAKDLSAIVRRMLKATISQ